MSEDYAKLAKQFGGEAEEPVDYAALAAEADVAPVGAALAGAETIGAAPWHSRPNLGLGSLPVVGDAGPSVTQVLSVLPAVGGLVGGVLGSPGLATGPGGVATALGGAALGGAAGEAASQLGFQALGGKNAPATSAEAAKRIGVEAAKQAAYEAGGQLFARGARTLGKGMVEQAVRPPMGMQAQFPDVIETIVKERIPVGKGYLPGSRKGSQKAADLLRQESKSVKALLAKATAGGKSFQTSKITKPVLDLIDEIADAEAVNPGGVARLEKLIDNFLAEKKGPLSPFDVQKLKQQAQSIAEPIYKARARGEVIPADQTVLAKFNEAVAKGAQNAMETMPGVAAGEARKRALIGAKRAVTQAERRRLSLMAESASGAAGTVAGVLAPGGGMDDNVRNGIIAWGLTRGVLHPRQMSRAGLVLTSKQAEILLRQFPKLADAVASASQAGEE